MGWFSRKAKRALEAYVKKRLKMQNKQKRIGLQKRNENACVLILKNY